MLSRRSAAVLAVPAAVLLTGLLSGCGTVTVPPGPDAEDPRCADVVLGAPPTMLGMDRHETSSQATVAWGSGKDTIVLRCGVTPPGPSDDQCTRLGDKDGVTVDWLVEENNGIVRFTTYGRVPAVDITVPREVAPDQPSAVALDVAGVVSGLPKHAQCLGPGDVK